MNELESSLRVALVVRAPLLDEDRLRAGVGRRLVRHRRRRVVLAASGGLAIAVAALALFARGHAPPREIAHTGAAAPPQQVHARRPVFARHYQRPPVPTLAGVDAALAQLRGSDFAQRTAPLPPEDLLQWGTLADQLRQLRPRGSLARVAAADEAVRTYARLYDDPAHRAWPRRDEALFACAYLLYEEEHGPEAQRLFTRLIEEHPGSVHAVEAAIALAEPLFEAGDLDGATRYYSVALTHPDTPFLGYALYKIGWVHVNRGERAAANAAFRRILALEAEGRMRSPDDAALVTATKAALAAQAVDAR